MIASHIKKLARGRHHPKLSAKVQTSRGGYHEAAAEGLRPTSMAGCCVFLRWPSTSHARLRYNSLDLDEDTCPSPSPATTTVTVVVGKEQRVFLVDQLVLDTYPFRLLLETVAMREERRGKKSLFLFLDVDAILFEHILWLACHDRSVSLLQLDLQEIIDFYSQDA